MRSWNRVIRSERSATRVRPCAAATGDRRAHAPYRSRGAICVTEARQRETDCSAVIEASLAEDPNDDEFFWSLLRPIGGYVAGANIVMQLSRLGVGRGVAESTVESG